MAPVQEANALKRGEDEGAAEPLHHPLLSEYGAEPVSQVAVPPLYVTKPKAYQKSERAQ